MVKMKLKNLKHNFDRDGYMKMYEDGQLLDSADILSIGEKKQTHQQNSKIL